MAVAKPKFISCGESLLYIYQNDRQSPINVLQSMFDEQNEKFVERKLHHYLPEVQSQEMGVCRKKEKHPANVICCAIVPDALSKCCLPYLLLQIDQNSEQQSRDKEFEIVCIKPESDVRKLEEDTQIKFSQCRRLLLPGNLPPEQMCLVAGPSMLWLTAGECYVSTPHTSIARCRIQDTEEFPLQNVEILWTGIINKTALVFLKEMQQGEPRGLDARVTARMYALQLFSEESSAPVAINITEYMSATHVSIITALTVVPELWVTPCEHWHVSSRGHVVFVATSLSQIVEFKNGRLSRCCWLSFSDACRLLPFQLCDGGGYLLVQSAEGSVSVISYKDFTVQKQLSEDTVHQIIIGDFLSNGNEQILFLKKKIISSSAISQFEGESPDHCWQDQLQTVLTDLQGYRFTTSSKTTLAGCPQDSLRKAVAALEIRALDGQRALREAEGQRQEKQMLIEDTWNAIKQMAGTGEASSDPSPSLVPLFDTNTSPSAFAFKPRCKLTMQETWIRVIRESLVIGLQIQNDDIYNLFGFCLSLVAGSRSVCQSCSSAVKVTKGGHYEFVRSPEGGGVMELLKQALQKSRRPLKRQRTEEEETPLKQNVSNESKIILLQGDRACVMAKTDLPTFVSQSVDYTLLLSWNETTAGGVAVCHQEAPCHTLSIRLSDITSGSFHVKDLPTDDTTTWLETERDIAAFNIAQECVEVNITSEYTDLTLLPKFFQDQLGMIVWNNWYYCRGALQGARVCLLQASVRKAKAVLYGWNEPQVVLLVQNLYSKLAADIRIYSETQSGP